MVSWLNQGKKGIKVVGEKKEIPDNLWQKCPGCGDVLYHRELERNHWVCSSCNHHLRITTNQYLDLLCDPGSWQETHTGITSRDPLEFKDSVRYRDRLRATMKKTGREEAVLTGRCRIDGIPVMLGVLDFEFLGGSMGSVVGEKLARLLADALSERWAAVVLSRSGGARMQESLLSLMQMAKTGAVLARLRAEGVPYVSILTNPTTGGVTASFAMLGDVHIAEPGALIGFAGPRVIQQTINSELPEGFQSSEFMLEKGQIDLIVNRRDLRARLAEILHWFTDGRDVSVRQPFRG
jgi:acetyl-CoA carboxylase carboxyl transferase subunit beta